MNEIDYQTEIEQVKKEADVLMMNKITKYEREIKKLKEEICELRNDNRKLAHQIEDQVDRARKAGM